MQTFIVKGFKNGLWCTDTITTHPDLVGEYAYQQGFTKIVEVVNVVDTAASRQMRLYALDEQFPNAIAIFGGAIFVEDIDGVIKSLSHIIKSVPFFEWHESVADACRRFCHLCDTDPMLVELYIGMPFETLLKQLGE
jgi:hypothetical protein